VWGVSYYYPAMQVKLIHLDFYAILAGIIIPHMYTTTIYILLDRLSEYLRSFWRYVVSSWYRISCHSLWVVEGRGMGMD
jgi:hypothetical protein